MKTTFKTGLAAILFFITLQCINAQEEMPTALAGFQGIEGYWEGPATMMLEGKTYQFTYHAEFRKTAGGKGFAMDEGFNLPELGQMMGSNLIGYNANDDKIHWFSVDNFGATHDHLGTWTGPGHFSMEAHEMMGQQKFEEKIGMVFKGKDTIELSLVATLDGETFQKGNVTFQRMQKGTNH